MKNDLTTLTKKRARFSTTGDGGGGRRHLMAEAGVEDGLGSERIA
jgi:hypothetical protein